MSPLPIYEIIDPEGERPRPLAEAEGIVAARVAVETLLGEGTADELDITLDGRVVETGIIFVDGRINWTVVGRSRDLR